jgi:hypothetical protein
MEDTIAMSVAETVADIVTELVGSPAMPNMGSNSNSDSDSEESVQQKAAPKPKTIKKTASKMKGIKKQPTTVSEWIYAKSKYPESFGYTADGDLEVDPVLPSDRKQIITLEKYLPASKSQITEYYQKRYGEDIQTAESDYTVAKRDLQQLILEYKTGQKTVLDVLGANQRVQDAECALNAKTKLPRYFYRTEGLMERELTFKIHDIKKFANPVSGADYNSFPIESFWTSAKSEAEVSEVPEIPAPEQAPPKTRAPISMAAIAAIRARRAAAASGYSKA